MNSASLFAANHLWQSTVFAAAAGLLTLTLRRNHARTRHWVWLIASLKFLLPFWVFVDVGKHLGWLKVSTTPVARLSFAIENLSQPFLALPIRAAVPAPALAADPLPYILLAVWLGGCIMVLFSWWRRWRRVARVIGAASHLPLVIGIPVVSSPALLEPGAFGIRRPVLLLPHGIQDRLTPEQLQAILAHELCHIRRRDNLAAAVHMAVETIFWFHPLVWWIGARLVEERERACDEEVLRAGNEPQTYAEGILQICKFYLESPVACMSGVTGADLKKRIADIMTQAITHDLTRGRKLMLAAAGIAAVACPVAIGLVNAPQSLAQSQSEVAALPAFEVASVKENKSAARGSLLPPAKNGRYTARNVSLKMLLTEAYHLPDFQISGGPDWLDSDRYDVDAKAAGKATAGQTRMMLQRLLTERFKLAIHSETKTLPLYTLTIAKNGSKLQPAKIAGCDEAASPSPLCGGFRVYARSQIRGETVSVGQLVDILTQVLGRPVVDKTGIKGYFDLKLEWTPENQVMEPGQEGHADATPGPTIFDAIQQQLGLKLEGSKGPVRILAIDHAEKATEN